MLFKNDWTVCYMQKFIAVDFSQRNIGDDFTGFSRK